MASSSKFLYLTTVGRRTGLSREIEIWFVEHDCRYYILAEKFHQAGWVKNILRISNVEVRLGQRTFKATARVLDKSHDRAIYQLVQHLAREKYGWGDGLPVEITPETPSRS